MIIGGRDESVKHLSVEVFDPNTGKSCSLSGSLPVAIHGHSGSVYAGAPTVCGGAEKGSTPTQTCYQYDSRDKQWSNKVLLQTVVFSNILYKQGFSKQFEFYQAVPLKILCTIFTLPNLNEQMNQLVRRCKLK